MRHVGMDLGKLRYFNTLVVFFKGDNDVQILLVLLSLLIGIRKQLSSLILLNLPHI